MSESSTTVFDADAIAIGPPELKIGGRMFVGRLLSIVEWLGFLERFLTLGEREAKEIAQLGAATRETTLDTHAFTVDYLRAVFPARREWFRRMDPVAILEGAGDAVLQQACGRFFGHQWRAMGASLRTPPDPAKTTTATTSGAGTPSRDSTTPAPSDAAGPS